MKTRLAFLALSLLSCGVSLANNDSTLSQCDVRVWNPGLGEWQILDECSNTKNKAGAVPPGAKPDIAKGTSDCGKMQANPRQGCGTIIKTAGAE